ncbi:hypothetical protein GCM10007418_03300 [Halopseudomonas salina]|uniref:Uncharacterized protein n=1 Tax=Halopseudomonas salina TaxID=1323744 RepID=A0ABQ1NXZ7_9GAMM|nr:hypothetical protein GCM10007418_03300 [Halopseudomonas salina]
MAESEQLHSLEAGEHLFAGRLQTFEVEGFTLFGCQSAKAHGKQHNETSGAQKMWSFHLEWSRPGEKIVRLQV